MLKIDDLTDVVFAGLSALVIEGVTGENDLIRVTTRTRDKPMPCPVCGTLTGRVHGYYSRTVADVPVDGRRVVISVQGRRLLCPAWECARQTFREQVPGLLERYRRRTSRLTRQLGAVVTELAGRAGARLSAVLAVAVSRSTALRLLMRLPLPPPRIPRVLGVDDFALKRRHRYATILTDAETGERIDVLPGRGADALEAWLRSHPGVEIVCRDGSGAYGEAIRRAWPNAVQVSDRWHLWANLCDKTLAEVRSHSACWATVNPPRPAGVREQTTRERWQQIHELLDKGVGLLECARRLNLSLNTVKRYARTREPDALRRAPRYRPTLVDPYRDHLRERRAADPAVPVQRNLAWNPGRLRPGGNDSAGGPPGRAVPGLLVA
ncbi:transposase IS204/IS1001/IS1096/IS1165 family protein [Nonomuraea fuscirosea]|uniref:Transposase IS204/IS1001/IS1096/IS1165 family protein n=1 Tax=Nonomuraea fuscirosea TaxID=1291556 RepID=A0A2T0LT02_9ACTN|nr:transposase IS204/IS1001/IS1096/IS1165 family protein [Nonomuraea fuscirosea]